MNLEEARVVLEAKRADLTDELARMTDVPIDPDAVISFGKRVGDGTTAAVERFSATAAAGELGVMLQQVNLALTRVEAESWGYCERCGEEISAERLEAIPWATLCIRDASAR